jgi:hypothetical protein
MRHAPPLPHRGCLADYREMMHAAALPGTVDDAVYGHVQERVVARVQGPREEALEAEGRGALGEERDARRLGPHSPAAPRRGTSRRAGWTPSGLRLAGAHAAPWAPRPPGAASRAG